MMCEGCRPAYSKDLLKPKRLHSHFRKFFKAGENERKIQAQGDKEKKLCYRTSG